jgi:hypothetical protein
MSLKINQSNNKTYCEVPQTNPLRWKTLYRNNDGSFFDQSGWVKCKDFYNDTVAFRKAGSVFSIYGYENNIKMNDEGIYFLLKYIKDKPSFFHNLEVVNKQLFDDLECVIAATDHEKDELVILIPNELWESTYRISMITMVVRLCNYGVKYESWEDMWKAGAPSQQIEHAFTKDAKENALKLGFKVPPQFTKYWYYAGPDYNSEKNPKQTGGIIHNNGVSNWSQFMKL